MNRGREIRGGTVPVGGTPFHLAVRTWSALHSRALSFPVSPLPRPCLPGLLPFQRVLTQPTRSPPSKSLIL